ncbi:HPP family protein, partial [Pseudomonas aeruginosa]
ALDSSPLAQPWSMLGGNLVAALAGGLSAYWFGHDLAPALVGMALGMLLMFALRCLHPPSSLRDGLRATLRASAQLGGCRQSRANIRSMPRAMPTRAGAR